MQWRRTRRASQVNISTSLDEPLKYKLVVSRARHHQNRHARLIDRICRCSRRQEQIYNSLRLTARLCHVNRPMKRCPTVIIADIGEYASLDLR